MPSVDLSSVWGLAVSLGALIGGVVWALRRELLKRINEAASARESEAVERAEKAQKLAAQYQADLVWLRGEQSNMTYKHDQAMTQLFELHKLIRERDETISDLKRTIDRRDQQISFLETELLQRDTKIASLESQVEILKTQMAALQRGARIG